MSDTTKKQLINGVIHIHSGTISPNGTFYIHGDNGLQKETKWMARTSLEHGDNGKPSEHEFLTIGGAEHWLWAIETRVKGEEKRRGKKRQILAKAA